MKILLSRITTTFLVAAALVTAPAAALAQMMSSTNYNIPFDAIGAGGLRSTSTNYGIEDTLSEFSSTSGENFASTNYAACVGYQCLSEAPFLNVAYAAQAAACDDTSATSPPFDVPLGTLSTSAVSTAANKICIRVTSNAGGGVVVKARSANAALKSASVPADMISAGTSTLVAGTAGYGFCSSNAQNGFTAVAPYNGSCNTTTNHAVGGVTTTDQTVWTASGAVNNAYGELLTKASISTTVPAHNDYQDTLTITVTGTF